MKKKSFIILLIPLLFLISCNNKPITLYVSNQSPYTKKNTLKIYINGKEVVKKQFEYSIIEPNYEVFEIQSKQGVNQLKIIDSVYGLTKSEDINPDEKFIFISFNEFKKQINTIDSIIRRISILKRKEYTELY